MPREGYCLRVYPEICPPVVEMTKERQALFVHLRAVRMSKGELQASDTCPKASDTYPTYVTGFLVHRSKGIFGSVTSGVSDDHLPKFVALYMAVGDAAMLGGIG
jgi:hypothetical protein